MQSREQTQWSKVSAQSNAIGYCVIGVHNICFNTAQELHKSIMNQHFTQYKTCNEGFTETSFHIQKCRQTKLNYSVTSCQHSQLVSHSNGTPYLPI